MRAPRGEGERVRTRAGRTFAKFGRGQRARRVKFVFLNSFSLFNSIYILKIIINTKKLLTIQKMHIFQKYYLNN